MEPVSECVRVHVCCRQEIIEKLVGQAVRLSQHKFASNVIEKCLQFGDSAGRQVCMQSHFAAFTFHGTFIQSFKCQCQGTHQSHVKSHFELQPSRDAVMFAPQNCWSQRGRADPPNLKARPELCIVLTCFRPLDCWTTNVTSDW